MGLRVCYEIRCGWPYCGVSAQTYCSTATDAKKDALRLGWAIADGEYYCPPTFDDDDSWRYSGRQPHGMPGHSELIAAHKVTFVKLDKDGGPWAPKRLVCSCSWESGLLSTRATALARRQHLRKHLVDLDPEARRMQAAHDSAVAELRAAHDSAVAELRAERLARTATEQPG